MAAGETVITVVGNLVDDPELRFTPSRCGGRNFTDRLHPAHLRPPDQRVEGRRRAVPSLLVWRQAAENVAESLTSAACG